MRRILRKSLKTIGKSLGLNKLFWCIHGVLQEPEKIDVFQKNVTNKAFGVFTDSSSNHFDLISGLRDRLEPNWRAMVDPSQSASPVPSRDILAQKIDAWRSRLMHVESFLSLFSSSFIGKEVLEVGANDGATAFALSLAGAKKVLATDIAAYYITQTPGGEVTENTVVAKNAELALARAVYAEVVSKQIASGVSFQEDDICSSSLPSQSFEVVVSWEVLEHLARPRDAFREMARILKPGGIAFHEYNPFFSIDGGHSLCTLDFLWGHTRLHSWDFGRYLEEIRPNEKDVALSFYENNLNRMTLSELMHYVQQAGLSPLCILPWYSKDHLDLVTGDIFSQCRRIYRTAELVDLIAPTVWVLLKKNDSSTETSCFI